MWAEGPVPGHSAYYEGEWVADKRHGHGRFSDGVQSYAGRWVNDAFQSDDQCTRAESYKENHNGGIHVANIEKRQLEITSLARVEGSYDGRWQAGAPVA